MKRDQASSGGADAKRPRMGPSSEDIARTIEEREAARKNRDYARADQLRTDLKAQGVELFDVDHEWRAADGRRGSMVASASGLRAACTLQDDHIVQMVAERERVRAMHDWPAADRLRESLRSQGVELLDKEKIWRAADGRVGLLANRLNEPEIQNLVGMREQERGARNFEAADRIRQVLREVGVRLDDRQSMWSTDDGRYGPFAAWQPGAAAPVQGMPHAPQMSPYTLPPPPEFAAYAACAAPPPPPPYGTAGGGAAMRAGGGAATALGSSAAAAASELEALVLVHELSRAMQRGDAALQAALRPLLASRGVAVDEQHATWHSADGRAGPLYYADEAMYHAVLSAAAAGGGAELAPDDVDGWLRMREQARAKRNFPLADRIRETLRVRGYRLDDEAMQWSHADGRSGAFPPAGGAAVEGVAAAAAAAGGGGPLLTNADIVTLVTQRESARRQRDFGAADALRERLRASGVSLLDKEKLWSTLDGRRGSFANEVPTVLQAEPPADSAGAQAEATAAGGVQAMAESAAEPSVNNNPRYRGE